MTADTVNPVSAPFSGVPSFIPSWFFMPGTGGSAYEPPVSGAIGGNAGNANQLGGGGYQGGYDYSGGGIPTGTGGGGSGGGGGGQTTIVTVGQDQQSQNMITSTFGIVGLIAVAIVAVAYVLKKG